MPQKILIVEDEAATSLDLENRLPGWGIPVVYLTAFATDAIIERAKATAPLGYMVKPGTERELRATLELALAKLAVDRQLHRREADLEQFKTMLDTTHDCVFMFRPQPLQFFYVNQGASDQTGYRQTELRRMHPYDLKPEYDEAKFRELVAPLQEGRELSVRVETVHRRKDGTDVPVEAFLQYIAPAGEPPRFVEICTDITQRKEAQRYALAQLQLEKPNAMANLTRLRLESLASDSGATLDARKELAAMLQGCVDNIASCLDVALVRVWTLAAGEQLLERQASAGRGHLTAGLHRHVLVGQDDIGRSAKDRARIFARPVAGDTRAMRGRSSRNG